MSYGAYWIAHVTVTDADAYSQYQRLAPAAFAAYGAVFLARGTGETLEGRDHARHVVIGFPTIAAARACYESAEYRAARTARDGAAATQIVIVEALAPLSSIG